MLLFHLPGAEQRDVAMSLSGRFPLIILVSFRERGLIFFYLQVRIVASQVDHNRTCELCRLIYK